MAYEDSVGPHGIPWRDALNPDLDGWFEVEETIDNAQAALDLWHKDHHGKDDVDPGTRLRVVDTRPAARRPTAQAASTGS